MNPLKEYDWNEHYQQLPHGHLLLQDETTTIIVATTTLSSSLFQELSDYVPGLKENPTSNEFINCMVHLHPLKCSTCTELLHHEWIQELVIS